MSFSSLVTPSQLLCDTASSASSKHSWRCPVLLQTGEDVSFRYLHMKQLKVSFPPHLSWQGTKKRLSKPCTNCKSILPVAPRQTEHSEWRWLKGSSEKPLPQRGPSSPPVPSIATLAGPTPHAMVGSFASFYLPVHSTKS